MGDKSTIEWTDATWNPLRGCSRISEGCRYCYAERVAARFSGPGQAYEGLARQTEEGPRWTGKVRFIEEHLEDPLRWKKPRNIFVNSMSDLFHEDCEIDWIVKIFAVMARCPEHTFQVLTKRPRLMRAGLSGVHFGGFWNRVNAALWAKALPVLAGAPPYKLPNVWLGTSVENQATADERVPDLLETPAAVRFLSVEPMLAPINLGHWLRGGPETIGWVIVGGESGPGARPMAPNWVREIRDQCVEKGIPFFFKQWGGVNKKKAGRELDGRTWDEMPTDA